MLPGSCLSWGLYKRYISLGLIGLRPAPPVVTAAQPHAPAGSGSGALSERMAM